MIKGLGVDMTPGLQRSESPKRQESGAKEPGFADQLLGAKSKQLEGPEKRSESRNKSGRDNLNREDSRSSDRETPVANKRNSRAEESDKPKAKQLSRNTKKRVEDAPSDNPAAQRSPAQERPEQDYYAPIKSQRSPDESSAIEDASADNILPSQGPLSKTQPTLSQPRQDVGAANGVKLPDFFSKAALAGENVAMPAGNQASMETASLLATMQQGEQADRAQTMDAFLTTMETELGVPPEKIMAAFAMMDDSALNASPEASVQDFIANLDLESPEQELRAEQLYCNLVQSTGDSLLNEKLVGMGEGVNFQIMSPRDSRLQQLDKSLAQMNQSFFTKDGGLAQDPQKAQAAIEAMDAELARMMQAPKDTKESSKMTSDESVLAGAGLGAGALAGSTLGESSVATSSATQGGGIAGIMSSSANANFSSNFGGSGGSENGGQLGANDSSQNIAVAAQSSKANDASFASEMKAELKDANVTSDVRSDVSSSLSDSSVLPGSTHAASPAPTANSSSPLAAGGPAAMMTNRQVTADDEQANVRELIKQAQVVLKRGGGEMKLEMTPEGMGQVHLKVAVENGQVNVQMLTESESAKRLLEKGIGELKTSLAAHQLNVEKVSIDVGQEISKQMDQQASQDQAREQARQQAQHFMGQFRDERNGFRQNMFDQAGFKSYGRNQNRGNVEPEQIAQASTSSRKQSADGSRRLSIVA